MNKRLKHNIISLSAYFTMLIILLWPLGLEEKTFGIALSIAFLFSLLNDIITELRKLNGEKFTNLEENNDGN